MGSLIHWDILDEKKYNVLNSLTQNIELRDYYLAGGTALSLQMKFRKSVDFDFFTACTFNAEQLAADIKNIFPQNDVKTGEINHNTCRISIDDIRISFLGYPHKMLLPYVKTEEMPGLAMAGIKDIAEMKLTAIGGRGTKKDFYDIYQILNNTDLTIQELCAGLYEKYGNRDFSYIGMGFVYFTDADKQKLPESYIPYDWEEIKGYFSDMQPQFLEHMERLIKLNEQNNLDL